MKTDDADGLLGDLLASLAGNAPLSQHTRRWLLAGLHSLARGEAASLDRALGLHRPTGRAARLSQRLRLAARNSHLRIALDAVAWGDVSDWQRCVRLAAEIQDFERTANVARLLAAPRPEWTGARRALWAAARLDLQMPRTASAIYRASQTGDFLRSAKARNMPVHASTNTLDHRDN